LPLHYSFLSYETYFLYICRGIPVAILTGNLIGWVYTDNKTQIQGIFAILVYGRLQKVERDLPEILELNIDRKLSDIYEYGY
jgi:hypothetical protein